MAAVKRLPVHRVVFLFLYFLVLWDFGFNIELETEYRSTSGYEGWGMSHLPVSLMNRLNRIDYAVFKRYFQRIPYWETNSCRFAVWRPYNVNPYINIVLLLFHFLVLSDYGVQNWARNWVARRRDGCRIFQYLSWTDSIKRSLGFSNFGCCIYNGYPVPSIHSCKGLSSTLCPPVKDFLFANETILWDWF